ncbi:MAG: DUF2516 family protein [Nocardioides sp.]
MPHQHGLTDTSGLLIFQIEALTLYAIWIVMIAVKGYAVFNAVTFSAASYPAADKLTKPLWLLILIAGLFTALFWFAVGGRPSGILQLGFSVAALVFLCDVKPALSDLRR